MQINKFVDEISIPASSAPLNLCVRKSKGRPRLNDVFTDKGLAGMIEAGDIRKMERYNPPLEPS